VSNALQGLTRGFDHRRAEFRVSGKHDLSHQGRTIDAFTRSDSAAGTAQEAPSGESLRSKTQLTSVGVRQHAPSAVLGVSVAVLASGTINAVEHAGPSWVDSGASSDEGREDSGLTGWVVPAAVAAAVVAVAVVVALVLLCRRKVSSASREVSQADDVCVQGAETTTEFTFGLSTTEVVGYSTFGASVREMDSLFPDES
jgi:hypothetical protein